MDLVYYATEQIMLYQLHWRRTNGTLFIIVGFHCQIAAHIFVVIIHLSPTIFIILAVRSSAHLGETVLTINSVSRLTI